MAFVTHSGEIKPGCAMLFALPFVLVGIGMAGWLWSNAIRHSSMQSWVEVPAKIIETNLGQHRAHHHGRRRGGRRRTSYHTTATYEFELGGKSYRGQRVGLHEFSDNFGDFQRRAYAELKRHRDSGKAFRCYVNPRDPSQSILYPQMRWELMSFLSIFPAVFGSAGLGIFAGVQVARRRAAPSEPVDVPKDEPWQARTDWASGRILPSTGSAVAAPVLTVIAVWWLIATGPLVWKLPGMLQASDSPLRWLALVYPLIGTVLVVAAVHRWIRRRNYGESILQLAATPGVIGGQLAGLIQIPRTFQADSGFRLKLSCIERKERQRDDHEHEVVHWQDERIVTNPMRDIAAGTMAVPVLFGISFDSKPTSSPKSNRRVRWQLDVSAATPGVNYKSRFEVPVFKTDASRADFEIDPQMLRDFAATPPRESVLREAGIVKEPLPGSGVRLIFPAARNPGSALFATAFLAFWSGVIWFMLHLRAPIVFPIVFGLVELFLIWVVADLWFYRSVVEARSDGLTFRGGLFGIGFRRFWPASEVKQFETDHSMSSGIHVWKNVKVELAGGKKRILAQSIGSPLAQQAVIDELNAALRRK
jgi:hypothetical protein